MTGDPFAFTVMQEHWSQGFCWISDTLWYVLENARSYPTVSIRYEIWIPTLAMFPLFFALLCYAWKRFRSMYTLYAFVYLVLNYSLSWLLSAGRYLSCALPFFLFAAALTEKRPWLTALLAGGMGAGFLIWPATSPADHVTRSKKSLPPMAEGVISEKVTPSAMRSARHMRK